MVQTGEIVYGIQGQAYRIKERKGAGGEGTVYLTDQPWIAAKIYHNPTAVQERKLRCMVRRKIATKAESGTYLIAWPKDILYQNGSFVGYAMPLIEEGKPIFTLYHDKSTRDFFNSYNWTKSLCVAMNLAHLVAIIHDCDCVIGDMNPGNIIVHPNGLASILDVDSFDITDTDTGEHFKCGVGIPDYLAPELQHRKSLKDEASRFTKQTDDFSLAIHIFIILFHYHPFLARSMTTYKQSSDVNQIDQNIVNGVCPFVREINDVALPVGAPRLSLLPPLLQEDFKRTFGYTALDSISKSSRRTSAQMWYEHLRALYSGVGTLILPCSKNPEHYRRADQPCELCLAKERYEAWMAQNQRSVRNDNHTAAKKEAAASAAPAPKPAPAAPAPKPAPPKKSHGFHWFLLFAGILALIFGIWFADMTSKKNQYESAVRSMNRGDYIEAIVAFKDLEDYKDSEELLREAKYGYIKSHLDCGDKQTYQYLKELRNVYSDCQRIYDSLYRWNVEILAVNTDKDDKTTNLSTFAPGSRVYWHIRVSGGTPGSKTDLYYQVCYKGEEGELKPFNSSYSNNGTGWVSAGLNRPGGTVCCYIYDENQELLCENEVWVSN